MMLDTRKPIYPVSAVNQPRRGRQSLIFKTFQRDNGLFEIKARRRVVSRKERERSTRSKSLVAMRRNTRQVADFHHLLGHSIVDITRGTAPATGVQLTRTQIPCVQCSEVRVRRYAIPKVTNTHANGRAGNLFVHLSGPSH